MILLTPREQRFSSQTAWVVRYWPGRNNLGPWLVSLGCLFQPFHGGDTLSIVLKSFPSLFTDITNLCGYLHYLDLFLKRSLVHITLSPSDGLREAFLAIVVLNTLHRTPGHAPLGNGLHWRVHLHYTTWLITQWLYFPTIFCEWTQPDLDKFQVFGYQNCSFLSTIKSCGTDTNPMCHLLRSSQCPIVQMNHVLLTQWSIAWHLVWSFLWFLFA